MIFYIRPPTGQVHFDTLQSCGEKRLRFLLEVGESEGHVPTIKDLIQSESVLQNADCLMEGSMRDVASHFLLRFAFCGRPHALDAFVRAETAFFRYRMETLLPEERYDVLKYAIAEANLTARCLVSKEYGDALSNLGRILEVVLERWDEILQGEHFDLSVPFEHVLSLVDRRLVTLKRGRAIISTSSLNDLLMSLFETVLRHGILHFRESSTYGAMAADGRLLRMQAYFEKLFYDIARRTAPYSSSGKQTSLGANEIDEAAKLFPPCMADHHALLRATHRLPHNMRVQYTLFLKEIGLPLDEALWFWSREYAMDSGAASSCSHTWNKDARRFAYSIRHLYGYEGSRKAYAAHSCRHLQENGGCPLVNSNKAELTDAFRQHHLQETDIEDVWKLCVEGRHLSACAFHWTKRAESQHRGVIIGDDNSGSNTKDRTSANSHVGATHFGKSCSNGETIKRSSVKFAKPSQYYLSLKEAVGATGSQKSL